MSILDVIFFIFVVKFFAAALIFVFFIVFERFFVFYVLLFTIFVVSGNLPI